MHQHIAWQKRRTSLYTIRRLEFCGTLFFAQAELNFSMPKIVHTQPKFGKILRNQFL